MRPPPICTAVMFLALGVFNAFSDEQAAEATPGSLRTSWGKALSQGVKIPTISLLSAPPTPWARANMVWR